MHFMEWIYITPRARIDAFNFPESKAELISAASTVKQIAYDMSGLQFMCLPMIQLLYKTAKELGQRGGRLALIGSNEKMKRQFLIYASLDPFLCISIEEWKAMEPTAQLAARAGVNLEQFG